MTATPDLVVLCYHGISGSWTEKTCVAPRDFERHLSAFTRRGYVGATFSDALTAPPAARTLVVTFDDALASVAEHALPAMERLGLPGTVFVPTDYPDSGRLAGWDGFDRWLGTEHEHELRCMGWDDLRALAVRGWEIGSHTCSHPRLTKLDDAQIADELSRSRQRCEEQIGAPCHSLAYPYSHHDDGVVRAVRDSGYRFAATVARSPLPPLPLRWPRIAMRNGESERRVRRRARWRRLDESPLAGALATRRGLRR